MLCSVSAHGILIPVESSKSSQHMKVTFYFLGNIYKSILFIGFTMLLFSFYLILTEKMYVFEWEVLCVGSVSICFPIILDAVGVVFSSVVFIISGSVLWFSRCYMESDPFKDRFEMVVLLFIFSMNLLIFIPNMIFLLLGWDGLGVVSFALVIYYQNSKSLGAGLLTVLSNRVGDVMILTAIGLTVNQGHWGMMSMWMTCGAISFCLLLGALTKSAQLPFSAWLPAAMAAPTPVSALVHSSTLVTAGVFLVIRFFYFISKSSYVLDLLLFISLLTCVMAGLAASLEVDLKKIIALSTLSQLGVMMATLGVSMPMVALYHLFTHAMFKALLFLCAGSMIYSKVDTQDIRKLFGLTPYLPSTVVSLNVANLSLCGFPFLSGFYSKDLVLEGFLSSNSLLMVLLMGGATVMTALYSFRLSFYVMWCGEKFEGSIIEENASLSSPTIFLSVFAIFFGFIMNTLFLGFEEYFFSEKLLIIIFIFSGIYYGIFYSKFNKQNFYFSSMWYTPEISTQVPADLMTNLVSKSLDRGWLEINLNPVHQKVRNLLYDKPSLSLGDQVLLFILSFSFLLF